MPLSKSTWIRAPEAGLAVSIPVMTPGPKRSWRIRISADSSLAVCMANAPAGCFGGIGGLWCPTCGVRPEFCGRAIL